MAAANGKRVAQSSSTIFGAVAQPTSPAPLSEGDIKKLIEAHLADQPHVGPVEGWTKLVVATATDREIERATQPPQIAPEQDAVPLSMMINGSLPTMLAELHDVIGTLYHLTNHVRIKPVDGEGVNGATPAPVMSELQLDMLAQLGSLRNAISLINLVNNTLRV